jgi:hypothetical protein
MKGTIMPQMRKLAPDEVKALENKGKGQRKLVEEQYDEILSEYTNGDYGEATLEPGENRLTVRNRLRAAAKRRGFDTKFRRTSTDLIRFQVIAHDNGAPKAAPVAPAVNSSDVSSAPKKRGGRPKKNP